MNSESNIRLPEALTPYLYFSHDRRRALALGASGRARWLEIDPARRAVEIAPAPLSLPMATLAAGDTVLIGSHALDRLLVATGEGARVIAAPSGELVAEVGRLPGRAHALSPSGRWLLSFEEETMWSMDLEREQREWVDTHSFHAVENAAGEEEWLHHDHVDFLATFPYAGDDAEEGGEERFWVAAGCYGFVVTHLARADESIVAVLREPGRSHVAAAGVIYDPTLVLWPFGRRHAFAIHGEGTGVVAVDPESGELHHCRVRPGGKQPYSFIRHVAPSADEASAYVRCRDGAFLWRVGEAPVRIAEPRADVLALYRGALLVADGESLRWVAVEG
ncbi:MAG TPA: hypothetical protein VFQ39_03490 [Longimicrobium sp.]|nr:hypothetical protein [Longimicrobium sp.]